MCLSSPSSNNDSAVQQQQAQAAAQEAQRQATITEGQGKIADIFSSYNPDYYSGLSTDYTNEYQPQVQDQYNQAQQALLYAQANQGITGSSAGAFENSQLDKQNAAQVQQVDSAANDYANSAKSQVQTLQNNLTNQLESTGDDSTISPTDLNQLNIQSVSSMTPLTGLFNNLTNQYGNYSAGAAAAGQNNTLNSGIGSLFSGSGSGSGSSKVVSS